MRSPFPGMDPFIEVSHLWEDFHGKLISEIERVLSGKVPDRYVVRTGERSYVALAYPADEDEGHSFLPDVAVTASRTRARATRKPKSQPGGTAVHAEPVTMRAIVRTEYRETFLEIRQTNPEHKLVTGIEVLSPSNKRPGSKGRRLYIRKRLAYLAGKANLVEIDLLRGGKRMPMVSPWPDSPYYLLVHRKKQSSRCSVWPVTFTAPLPPLPIPLTPPDEDVILELQPLIAEIYSRSRYERDIDYRGPLTPPFTSSAREWLERRLDRVQP